jgi:hypothetical protein
VVSEEWSDQPAEARIDVFTPSPARLYDYYLGGKDNFTADREAAEVILTAVPEGRRFARENRDFLRRAVRHLTDVVGIRQFIDLGTGLPTQGNVHEVAQEIAPEARIVYVDNDPIVLAHGEAMLATNGNTVFIQADIRRPEEILSDPRLKALIDFSEPVAVLFVSVLQFVPDDGEAAGVVRRFSRELCSGSRVVMSTITSAGQDESQVETITGCYQKSSAPAVLRDRARIERLVDGLDLIPPGLVPISQHFPAVESGTPKETSWILGAVAAIS